MKGKAFSCKYADGSGIVEKYLLDVGGCVVYLLKSAHDLRIEWLVATARHGAEVQPALARETVVICE